MPKNPSLVKYDRIGKNYNHTRKADPFLFSRMIHHLQPTIEKKYIDIGCGTGNYTSKLSIFCGDLIGIDPSEEMLKISRQREEKIQWLQGTAENLPLDSNTFDGGLASLTIHHWQNLQKGFSEIKRVLKRKSRFVIFTALPSQMMGYWLNHYFPKMMMDSTLQMPSSIAIDSVLKENELALISTEKYFIKTNLEDKFLYAGKHQPKLYLEEEIRNGISSFSHLAYQQEAEEGLAKLSEDINTGNINSIMDSFENNDGDYIFYIIEKP